MSTENEEIGDLTGPIEEAYDETNTRTLDRMGVLVAILDDKDVQDGMDFVGVEVEVDSPVPVIKEGTYRDPSLTDILGSANVWVEGDRVYADIFLDYASPERLTIQTGGKLVPALSGYITEREANKIKKITIKHVLLAGRNTDPRIPAL